MAEIVKKQFDPRTMFAEALDEADMKINEALSIFGRLQFLREKMADEFARVEAKSNEDDRFTEEEAAAELRIDVRVLADLRRTHKADWPHIRFSQRDIVYTREHLREICEMFEFNKQGKASLRKAA